MAGKKMSGVYVSWAKPVFSLTVKTNKNFRTNFHAAMMYAHYELTSNELKKEALIYLKKTDNPLLVRAKEINEDRFTTVGKYMYVLNHGGDVPEDMMKSLIPHLEKTIHEEEIKRAAEDKKAVHNILPTGSVVQEPSPQTIQDRLKAKAKEVAGEIEGWIDDFCMNKKLPAKNVEDFTNLYKQFDLKAPHMRHMHLIFVKRANEIAEAAEGKNKDLIEAYSNFTKPELKKFDLFHKNLLKAAEMMQEVAKAECAPRKKKPISTEKLVSKLKYKKEDASLGIVSLNPSQIIGAKEVWCFDTKTRKLIRYVADDLLGPLSVKGASIIGFNHAKSVSKTLRKPVDQLTAFKKCGKVQLRTFIEGVTTTGIVPSGKINEHQIILRAEK